MVIGNLPVFSQVVHTLANTPSYMSHFFSAIYVGKWPTCVKLMHDYVVCAHLCVTCVNEAVWINVYRATRDKPGPVGVGTMFFAIAMVLWWLCFLSMLVAWSTTRQSCWQSKEHFACLSPLLNQPCGRKRIGVHYRLGVFFSFAP